MVSAAVAAEIKAPFGSEPPSAGAGSRFSEAEPSDGFCFLARCSMVCLASFRSGMAENDKNRERMS